MKSFKEYLIESKVPFEFKVKLVGECDKETTDKIKTALQTYNVEHISTEKTTPIQETQVDFPNHKNVCVTVINITTAYPVTSVQIQNAVADCLNISHADIKVRNKQETAEEQLNHLYDVKTGKAFLGSDYDSECHQELVGDKHSMSFLSTLNSMKTTGTQYTGVNDELFPQKSPVAKDELECNMPKSSNSIVGSTTVKKPSAKKGK